MLQALAQGWVGAPCTAFQSVVEGSRTVRKGEVVLLAGKPQVMGAVLAFTVPQACFSLPEPSWPVMSPA